MNTMSGEMQMAETGRTATRSTGRRALIGAAIVAVGAIGWYLFRPELLFVDQSVNETLPVAAAMPPSSGRTIEPKALATGAFHKGAHDTKGMATIHELANGQRVLRLTDFETSNGPDVHVYLVAASDALDSETVKSAGHIELGKLKGNVGDQNYDVPSDVDLNRYRAVTIWCARFGVNFGTAPLNMR